MRISDWSSDVCSSDLLASEMPRVCAWPLAAACCAYGWWLAGREWRRSPLQVLFPHGGDPVTVWGHEAFQVPLAWRRSEERRVGKEFVRRCRSRGSPCHLTKQTKHTNE